MSKSDLIEVLGGWEGYLDGFEQVWEVLIPHEKKKLVGLLLERVTFNPKTEEVTISLHDLNERE